MGIMSKQWNQFTIEVLCGINIIGVPTIYNEKIMKYNNFDIVCLTQAWLAVFSSLFFKSPIVKFAHCQQWATIQM